MEPGTVQQYGSRLFTSHTVQLSRARTLPSPPPRDSEPTLAAGSLQILLPLLPLGCPLAPKVQSVSWHPITDLPFVLIVLNSLHGMELRQESAASALARCTKTVHPPALGGVRDEVASRGEGGIRWDACVQAKDDGPSREVAVAADCVDVEAVNAHRGELRCSTANEWSAIPECS